MRMNVDARVSASSYSESESSASSPSLDRDTRSNGISLDPGDPELTASRDRLLEVCGRLLDRAQASGQLRHDVGAGDLLVAVSRLTRPLPGTRCSGSELLARRHLQIFLDGLRAPARSELPGAPAQVEDLEDELI